MRESRGMGAISEAKRPRQKKRRDDTSFTQYADGGEVDSDLEAMRRANAKSKAARLAAAMAGVRGESAPTSKAYSKPMMPEAKKVERPNFVNPKDVQRYREEMQGIPELAKGGKVNAAGNYTKPGMRKALFNKIKAQAVQGTDSGEWSGRKAQLLAKKYKAKGGSYRD